MIIRSGSVIADVITLTMKSIATQNLTLLPEVEELRRLLQSLATLDAIMTLDNGGGYYYFDCRWAKNQQVGQMTDGSGDDFHAYFNRHGCFLKGFAHESTMSPYQHNPKSVWPGVLEDVPPVFDSALNEPAFSMEDTTYAIWRQNADNQWSCGNIEFPEHPYRDGSEEMLSILDGQPNSYVEWATEYYETEIETQPVEHIYQHLPANNDIVKSLNPDATLGKLNNRFVQIGYPIA